MLHGICELKLHCSRVRCGSTHTIILHNHIAQHAILILSQLSPGEQTKLFADGRVHSHDELESHTDKVMYKAQEECGQPHSPAAWHDEACRCDGHMCDRVTR